MSTATAQEQQRKNPKSGHVHTMTPEQKNLLQKFWVVLLDILQRDSSINGYESTSKIKEISQKKQINDKYNESAELSATLKLFTPEELRMAYWRLNGADDPDLILLRFLRARKWDVDKALAMLMSTLKWRYSFDVDSIIRDGEVGMEEYFAKKGVSGFRLQFTSGKSFCHGTDKEGRPIIFINVYYHKKDEQSFEVLQKFTVWMMETVRLMLYPPTETACLVFNMQGFTLQNMDMSYIKFMVQCFEAYYPESLGICIVHQAPWVFQSVWKIIKPWLDPVVASKVTFTSENKDLLDYIPAEHLLSSFGGEDKYEYEYVPPSENENERMKDTATKNEREAARKELDLLFEQLTRDWIASPLDKHIEKRRDELKVRLRAAQLELDPYIRARTYYHRIGVLRENGTCDWVYTE